ncbi:hypothetical protein [Phaeobacter piscinae]|uniref:hypothetical protein n=1 Tax=Phaeobacter piscinae TaxID=1580596 RepID=UPI000C9A14C6|nr:hypothetical protein [Phaeobacter piscinae]AUQ75603.1 hypothetical protein PhaeoP71_02759 [Phaeobacter piscinae]
MLTQGFATVRTWSSILNRLGFGVIALFLLSKALLLTATAPEISDDFSNVGDLALTCVVLLSSLLLGAIVIEMGTLLYGKKYSPLEITLRAAKVSRENNPLLEGCYKDAMLKLELAFGFRGILLFSVLCVPVYLALKAGEAPTIDTNSTTYPAWKLIPPALLGVILSKVTDRAALSAVDAIDETLETLADTL